MKKLSTLLAIIAVLAFIGCATAGPNTQSAAPDFKQAAPATVTPATPDVIANIQAQIKSYDAPIVKARKALEATPEWAEYKKQVDAYNAALKVFKEADAKVAKLKELQVLKYLQARQAELKRLLSNKK